MAIDDRSALAAEAFIYGFPLVSNLQQVERFLASGIGDVRADSFNEFGHASEPAGPEATFVSINNDTIYSIAQIDLRDGPVRLDVPDSSGRYYVLQFVDAWTNNFAYVGHRATGTGEGSFLLVAPGDDSRPTEGTTVIHFPTAVGTIVGRWAVSGHADLDVVGALQSALTLTPTRERSGRGLPAADPSVSEDLIFFEQMRVWMHAFPPARRDLDYQARFEPLGLLDAASPYADVDPGLRSALLDGLAEGRNRLEQFLVNSPSPTQHGWNLTYHIFDYNLDFFEVGAIDDEQWKAEDEPRSRYPLRAGAARGGLWGNHGYEAAYAMVYVDGDGQRLNGGSRYQLHFEKEPPWVPSGPSPCTTRRSSSW